MAFIADYQGTRVLYPNQYIRINEVKLGKNNVVTATYGIYMQNPNDTGEEAHEVKMIDFDGSDYTGINLFEYAYEKTKHQFMIKQDYV